MDDDFLSRQIDFIPILVKFLFLNKDNKIRILSVDNEFVTVYVDEKGRFRRIYNLEGKDVDEPIDFTINDAIAVASQLEQFPSKYPDEYKNAKEEIKAFVDSAFTDETDNYIA